MDEHQQHPLHGFTLRATMPRQAVRPAHRMGRASGPLSPRLCRVPGGAGGSACPAPAEQGSPSLHLPCLLNAPGTARSSPAQPLLSQEDFGVVFPRSCKAGKCSYCLANASLSQKRLWPMLTESEPLAAPVSSACQPSMSS